MIIILFGHCIMLNSVLFMAGNYRFYCLLLFRFCQKTVNETSGDSRVLKGHKCALMHWELWVYFTVLVDANSTDFYSSQSCLSCDIFFSVFEVKVHMLKAIIPGDCHLILMLNCSAPYTSDLLVIFAPFESGTLLLDTSFISELVFVLQKFAWTQCVSYCLLIHCH